jgi:hypothetical protein
MSGYRLASTIHDLAGGEAELVSLSFPADRFTPSQVATWLAERRFTPLADVPILRTLFSPVGWE